MIVYLHVKVLFLILIIHELLVWPILWLSSLKRFHFLNPMWSYHYAWYDFNFMTFNLFNNLLIGYKWSTRVNDKLLPKDISEDHEHNISFSQINLIEARENFFKNTRAHRAKKDISEALEQFHRKELRWRDVNAAYIASLATIWGLYFI